ncbi:DUF550 domain-containing protein [Salmonella enterica]|uniref:DUF550 domain-containing protein n=3 Tax=Salmonella enterica TaxID=28901 RepID=A0A635KH45_SALET|nr:dATP/dGTP pyrophosphohydrolase domain-containing protein [Salmonella enterica]EBP3319064.1 DUF550 domain-containing protein [Salmonella enterica subsp. enterica]ECM0314080.1 DUF550 domain-containing protein [Salmonella enterica subsp. enterica serovar Enteritidis]EDR9957583.1 DUF550 domain-containing protein [Salmonella enterica subsp. enterica serovar Javiana]EDS1823408.1 DUF550 domain-containing protein [Salmonella enterica subsp. enterica serovar 6,8:-:1,2]EDX7012833.1 DUF550 domain-cont
MTTITKERIELFIKSPLENGLTRGEQMELARIALVSLDAEPVSQPYKLPEEKGASLQLRNLIRKRHAEWSDSTFGNVGPVGPLKHLSKEALEAAAEPGDLSEWADMQFLLWDAQRRAGISDGEITAAMEEKLKVNMARQWPEPKDGEPRLHIKEQPAPVVPAEMPKGLAGQIVSLLAHNIGDKFLAQKIWYACRAAMLQRVENAESRCGNPKVSPDGWIPVSERMPEESGRYWCYVEEQNSLGKSHYQWNCSWNGQAWSDKALSGRVTHWMPLPEPPQEEK